MNNSMFIFDPGLRIVRRAVPVLSIARRAALGRRIVRLRIQSTISPLKQWL